VNFIGVEFSGSDVSFNGAEFCAGPAHLRSAADWFAPAEFQLQMAAAKVATTAEWLDATDRESRKPA
jgi:hypothetical protein